MNWFEQSDPIGPTKQLLVRDPSIGLKGIVVVDNVGCGPAIGGLRMSPTVSAEEVARLARAMTWKSAAAGLPHGGAKSGIVADPQMPPLAKERLIRGFARAIANETDYIPGPDMGTDEAAMAFIDDEIGRAAGLPRVVGGIPLDEIGATGFGLAVAAAAAEKAADLPLSGARVVIQGFGNVGLHAAEFLAERGAVIVAVSDSKGGVANADGLDVAALVAHKQSGQSVRAFSGGNEVNDEQLVALPCDIWVPAAQPDVIRGDNAAELKARLILPGANIAVTAEAEATLHERGVLVLPDFVVNAGGLICAAVEVAGGNQTQALSVIEERIRQNTTEVIARSKGGKVQPRRAAEELARARVTEAMSYRRKGIEPLS